MRDVLTSALFDGPQCRGGWSVAAIATATEDVATRVVYTSDIDAADFGMVGVVASEATAGTRGEGEGAQAG